jgi:hypothetical protein
VYAQPKLTSRSRDVAVGRDGELELHPLGRECRDEPQQRKLGAAGLGRLGHGEYA